MSLNEAQETVMTKWKKSHFHLSPQVRIVYGSSLCKQHKLHKKAIKEHDKHSNILHNFNKANINKALSIQAKIK